MDGGRILWLFTASILLGIAFTLAPAGSSDLAADTPSVCAPALPRASGTTVEPLERPEGTRSYRLHVPPSYDGARAMPVVLNFHGATGSAAGHELYTAFSQHADKEGIIVVYPEGSLLGWPFTHFNALQLPSPEPDDVAFVAAILDELAVELCFDAERVYATGFSNGGWMAARLACILPDRIAAIALIASAYYPPLDLTINPEEACESTSPMPLLAMHGTSDTHIPFAGGVAAWLNFRLPLDDPLADDVMEAWAQHNRCAGGRTVAALSPIVRFVSYGDCDNGSQVRLYALTGLQHAWPSGSGPHGVSANEAIWQFFEDYTLAAPAETDNDGDTVVDALDPDDDGDTCLDVMEMRHASGSEMTGGRRDPETPWDFFDTDKSSVVNLDDIFNVALAYGTEPDSDGYNVLFDRSSPAPGAPRWAVGPPDGKIDLVTDIVGAALQFGHRCG